MVSSWRRGARLPCARAALIALASLVATDARAGDGGTAALVVQPLTSAPVGGDGAFEVVLLSPGSAAGWSVQASADPKLGVDAAPVPLAASSAAQALPPIAFTKNGANRFRRVDAVPGKIATFGADPVAARIRATVSVTPPANARGEAVVRYTLSISDPGGVLVRTLTGEAPARAASARGNAEPSTAELSVAWNLQDDRGAQVPPGVYAFRLDAVARSPGTMSLKVGNVLEASGPLLVASGGAPVAKAVVRFRAAEPGVYPVVLDARGADPRSGERAGAVAYVQVDASGARILDFANAFGTLLAEQVRQEAQAYEPGEPLEDEVFIPTVGPDDPATLSDADTPADATLRSRSAAVTSQALSTGPYYEGTVRVDTLPDDTKGPHGVEGLFVKVYRHRAWWPDDLQGATVTDANGHFQIPIDNKNGKYYAVFRMRSDTFRLGFPAWFTATLYKHSDMSFRKALDSAWSLQGTCGGSWCYKTRRAKKHDGNVHYDVTLTGRDRVRYVGELTAGAMETHYQALAAERAYLEAGGRQSGAPPRRWIHYPSSFCPDTACAPPFDPVNIGIPVVNWVGDAIQYVLKTESWTVEMPLHEPFLEPATTRHEYGHTVMYDTLGTLPILQDVQTLTECGTHYLTSRESQHCAFTEGWADFWQALSPPEAVLLGRANPAVLDENSYPVSAESIHRLGPFAQLPQGEGAAYEGLVAGGLWDLIDFPNDADPGEPVTSGDRNASNRVTVQQLLAQLKIASVIGVVSEVHIISHLWDALRGARDGYARIIDTVAEAYGAAALRHNKIGADGPPPPPPPSQGEMEPPVPVPTDLAVNPLGVIMPPTHVLLESPVAGADALVGFGWGVYFGKAVVAADVDGDGLRDLVVGSEGSYRLSSAGISLGIGDSGAVLFYMNRGDRFELDFDRTLTAPVFYSNAQGLRFPAGEGIGSDLAVGDLDGDGARDDVLTAAHAPGYQAYLGDDTLIAFFGGTPGRYLALAPPRPAWFSTGTAYAEYMHVAALDILDVNGDGRDDVVATLRGDGPFSNRANTAVAVYLGPLAPQSCTAGVPCGPVPRRPSAWLVTDPAVAWGQGRSFLVTDVDGDGVKDLAIAGGVASGDGTPVAAVYRGPIRASTVDRPPDATLALAGANVRGDVVISGDAIGAGLVVGGLCYPGRWPSAGRATLHAFAPASFPLAPWTAEPLALAQDDFQGVLAAPDLGCIGLRAEPLMSEAGTLLVGLGALEDAENWLLSGFGAVRLTRDASGALQASTVVVPNPVSGGRIPTTFGWDFAAVGDVNGDGTPDAAVADMREGVIWLYSGADLLGGTP
ncbi:hypothetical protein [Anaeromyxobacter terrae]|uniref:hypothetical protein n=1 Tax=Anaeromyxobacter terrae TaxID=2925406 RepID=UPI001F57C840|nr:hypothetical protein [Anaeromyxobacter sp. SG22]